MSVSLMKISVNSASVIAGLITVRGSDHVTPAREEKPKHCHVWMHCREEQKATAHLRKLVALSDGQGDSHQGHMQRITMIEEFCLLEYNDV
jgi:hypothetical protein